MEITQISTLEDKQWVKELSEEKGEIDSKDWRCFYENGKSWESV